MNSLTTALQAIADGGCTNYTQGCCRGDRGRSRDAKYTADRWCHACIAQDGLDRAQRSSAQLVLRKNYQPAMEANFDNQREAFELLGLIDAEFRTDPMSVQCFDLRTVARVRLCVAARKKFEQEYPYP